MVHRANSVNNAQAYTAMLDQARRMKTLIDDLITLARLEHNNTAPPELIDLNDVCARLPLNFDRVACERIHISGTFEPAYVTGNEQDIAGGLCALVDNALKYAPNGSIEVSSGCRRRPLRRLDRRSRAGYVGRRFGKRLRSLLPRLRRGGR